MPAAQRRETTAGMPPRPAPPEAPPAAGTPARARAEVPENAMERARPPRPAPGRAAQSPEQSYKSAHTLKNISLTFAGNDMRLLLEADSAFPCKIFALSGPDRLVIDLPGAWKGMKAPTVPGNRIVRKARVGLQSSGARLVLDLSSPLKNHKVEQRGNLVEILVQ
jgi:N-acetylmuramoyl-L-alanine amidase